MSTGEKLALGSRVGAALSLKGTAGTLLSYAVEAIDKVHGDGALPSVPVRFVGGRTHQAAFKTDLRITVTKAGRSIGFSFLHEIGHLLDYQAIDGRRAFASETGSPALDGWRASVHASSYHKMMSTLKGKTRVLIEARPGKREYKDIKPAFVEYLLLPRELFARSYAQYIVLTSGDVGLRRELDDVRRNSPPWYPEQWEDSDFEPVRCEFDALMETLGWRGQVK